MGSVASVGLLSGIAASGPSPIGNQSAWSQDKLPTESETPEKQLAAKARQCILIWLDGGPSHLEMFDPKPDQPAEIRGPLATIRTPLSGVYFSELLPQTAARINDLAVIRSMTSPLGEHNLGTHYLLTGYKPTPAIDYPAFGSVFTARAETRSILPRNIAIPDHRVGGGGFQPDGFLSAAGAKPFEVGGDPSKPEFRVEDLDWYPGATAASMRRRRDFLNAIDRFSQTELGASELNRSAAFDHAFQMTLDAETRGAFDLNQEPAAKRGAYGGKSIGQCCLLARRLIERGVSMVTINNVGWDTHDRLSVRLRDGYDGAKIPVGLVPSLDQALAALLDDLKLSGLIDQTLIVVMGEFGRTPKLNTLGGRDHWPRAFSAVLAGGGIRGGQVIGGSDSRGESPRERPVTPRDLIATIYHALQVDISQQLVTADGRPISLTHDSEIIHELF
jgi:uncharacterized protein (DUF1501 family)